MVYMYMSSIFLLYKLSCIFKALLLQFNNLISKHFYLCSLIICFCLISTSFDSTSKERAIKYNSLDLFELWYYIFWYIQPNLLFLAYQQFNLILNKNSISYVQNNVKISFSRLPFLSRVLHGIFILLFYDPRVQVTMVIEHSQVLQFSSTASLRGESSRYHLIGRELGAAGRLASSV